MTQVPDHLLERSRARRAALGLGGDAPEAPPAAAAGDAGAAQAPAMAEAPLAAPAPAPARPGATPGPATPSGPPAPAAPLPDYVRDPGPKSGIPYWVMPILLILPLWAIVYMGSFGERVLPDATPTPAGLYTTYCAACHGAAGQGGVGPAVGGGESIATFPDEEDHVTWVVEGSSTKRGQPYGDPSRAGGQRVATSGGMPGFAGILTDEEIRQVVAYERNDL
ncbi:MAG: cytochrome c [Actinomycetota bacterium]